MSTPSDRPTLLLVDDQKTNLVILREILKDDYQLLFAKDGLQALELAAEHVPDLILCDVTMPTLDGFSTCRRLKQNPVTAAIPVIFLTGLADDANQALGFEAGAVDYVYKPVSPPVLFARVRTHLKLVSAEKLEELNAELKRLNLELEDSLDRLRSSFESSVSVLSSILEQRNGRLAGYCQRTAVIARQVADIMGMSEANQQHVYYAALLHEIGKIGFSNDLLDKPQAQMTPDELRVFKHHPLTAELILMPMQEMANVSPLIRHQHERIDGKGFPDGLAGDAVPLGASILAVTKYYLDLVMGRRASQTSSRAAALNSARAQIGVRFPGAVVDALKAVVEAMPEEEGTDGVEVGAFDLRADMILATDWRNQKGVLLLAGGLVLSEVMVRQIQSVARRAIVPLTLSIKRIDAKGLPVKAPPPGSHPRPLA